MFSRVKLPRRSTGTARLRFAARAAKAIDVLGVNSGRYSQVRSAGVAASPRGSAPTNETSLPFAHTTRPSVHPKRTCCALRVARKVESAASDDSTTGVDEAKRSWPAPSSAGERGDDDAACSAIPTRSRPTTARQTTGSRRRCRPSALAHRRRVVQPPPRRPTAPRRPRRRSPKIAKIAKKRSAAPNDRRPTAHW